LERAQKEALHEAGHRSGWCTAGRRLRHVAGDQHTADRYQARGVLRRVRGADRTETEGVMAMKTHWQILVVDDEEVMANRWRPGCARTGTRWTPRSSGREAVEKAGQRDYAIYFVDLKMPGGMDGIETMMQIRRLHPEASIIIITAYATVDTAITAMKEGAQEYIVKPCNPEEISLLVSRIIKVKNLQRENSILRKKLSRQYRVGDVISKNARMQDILKLAAKWPACAARC
jgi:DNA-binding NtrC family response regulator